MPRIKVLSRSEFSKFIKEKGITDETVDTFTDLYLISINTTYGNDSSHFFKQLHGNVLTLDFDDTDFDSEYIDLRDTKNKIQVKAMTEDQGEQIYNFVKNIKPDSDVIVHCTLGKSRSGAVGAFINDYFGQRWDDFKQSNPRVQPNSHIASTLRKFLY